MAGPDLVSWDLTALGPQGSGPFRLVVQHENGCITEHFDTVASALLRQGDIEALLIAARGALPFDPNPKSGQASPATCREERSDDPRDRRRSDPSRRRLPRALNQRRLQRENGGNAETGLREATAYHADAIIVDFSMPLINGLGFLYRLRTSDEHRNTPVAIVTGAVVDDSVQAELNELGAELRFKPLWLEDVVAARPPARRARRITPHDTDPTTFSAELAERAEPRSSLRARRSVDVRAWYLVQ